jgi:hypothetical protein
MNFSAQGYAQLTALLQPDIAVLEGGYSIEGALPYLNVGIILAMAGIDYGNIREPGYDPRQLQQPEEVTQYIGQVCKQVNLLWQNRDSIAKEFRGDDPFATRRRNIFYDTDSIHEQQLETLCVCRDCSGALQIESTSDRGASILAVHVPRKACQRCKDIGHEWFEASKPKRYDAVMLQDRTEDLYVADSA